MASVLSGMGLGMYVYNTRTEFRFLKISRTG